MDSISSNIKLNVGTGDNLWTTNNFAVQRAKDGVGYNLVNTGTDVTEMFVDIEANAVIAILWLQETYAAVMVDPVAEYTRRHGGASITELRPQPGGKGLIN